MEKLTLIKKRRKGHIYYYVNNITAAFKIGIVQPLTSVVICHYY